MKRVLHLNASSGGGAFVVAQRLNEALNATGQIHSEHLVFTGNPGPYKLWADTWLKKKYAFGLHALEKLDFLRYEKDASVRFAFSHALTGIDISENPLVKQADIIHLHWINKGFISLHGLEKLLKTGKPVVWTCHDMWPFTGGCYHNRGCDNFKVNCGNCKYLSTPSDYDLSFKTFETKKRILNNYTNLSLITPSNWLAGVAEESGMGVKIKNVIPNGIDTAQFTTPDSADFVKNTGTAEVLFISANLSNPYKGFSEFIEFCRIAKDSGVDYSATVIGTNIPKDLKYEDLPLKFVGLVSDSNELISYYQNSDLYITTSLEENLPTTPIESISCGTPVVGFDVGGMRDIIQNERQGCLVPKGDVQGLFEKFLENRYSKYKLHQTCRKKALEDFDIGATALKHLALYSIIN